MLAARAIAECLLAGGQLHGQYVLSCDRGATGPHATSAGPPASASHATSLAALPPADLNLQLVRALLASPFNVEWMGVAPSASSPQMFGEGGDV